MRVLRLMMLCMVALLVGCAPSEPPVPEGPTMGDLPVMPGAVEIESDIPRALVTIGQVHRETVNDPNVAMFEVDEPLIDTIGYYQDELNRFGWTLIDVLEFGDGGFVRRYHLGDQRAILAFHPEEESTDFMLMQGSVR